MLVLYVDHIGRSLRVSSLIELVGDDTRRLLDEQYPDTLPDSETLPIDVDRLAATSVSSRRSTGTSLSASRVGRLRPARGAGRGQFRAGGSAADQHRRAVDRLDRDAAAAMSNSAWSERSTRTSPTDSGCSSMSPSDPCPSRRSSIQPPPCSRSTVCTTAFDNWRCESSPTVAHDDGGASD